jgi:hypothetical protein
MTLALTPTPNEALLREVDDAVRQDDLRQFWIRYGRLLIAAVVLGLAAFAGYLIWKNYQQEQAEANSVRYAEMLAGTTASQVDQNAIAELSNARQPGYRAGALLSKAAVTAAKGDTKGAVAAYGVIIADTSLAQPFRDVALIRQTALQFDTLPPQQVIDRLHPFVAAGSPWLGTAGELSALASMKLGKNDQAGTMFAAIARDPNVPRTIQTRAVQMASLLGVDAQVAPKPGETKDNAVNAQ